MPGPIPERSDRRRRTNKPDIEIESAPAAEVVVAPVAERHWHPLAKSWFLSLAQSGQSRFYEPSDWQTACVWAEVLSRALLQGARPSSQLIMAWSAGATELLVTEGARRRMRIELAKGGQVDDDAEAAVTAMDAYRKRLG